ncbi:hypothetical protein CRG98_022272 [Punica granatum]|uniref:Uncharacterized protein n=1 Tax=Punica granatum TaxID=22663 RepID=A0A2I0JM31_PUNGR|nr:hypothetical protein CRG98_022272 [Punica granatum]
MDVCERNHRKICHAKESQEDLMTLVSATDSDVMNFESSIFIGDEIVSTIDIIHNPDISAHDEPRLVSAGLTDPYVESKLEQELSLSALVPSHAVGHKLATPRANSRMNSLHPGENDAAEGELTNRYLEKKPVLMTLFQRKRPQEHNSQPWAVK